MSTTALFVIVKIWKQFICLSMGEWLNKVWYLCIMKHYSAVRRNERLLHATIWRDVKGVMLNEQKLILKICLYNILKITKLWRRQTD